MTYISILCPSRGRVNHLKDSFDSLLEHAATPGGIEFLVRLDWQDAAVPEYLAMLLSYKCRVVIGDQRQRYISLHHFYNELGAIASSRWMFLWNDDCVLESANWDRALSAFDRDWETYR